MNFGKVKIMWYNLKDIRKEVLGIVANILSIEFGLNIISIELGFNIVGKHDLRISKKNISVKL